MENLVPLGTGNSRFMKSNISPDTSLAQLIQMLNNGTFPYDVGPINPAGISQQGTPLNKATLLQDATAALYGLGSDAVPDDVLAKLAEAAFVEDGAVTDIDGNIVGPKIATGSYVGTGSETVGPSIGSDFEAKFAVVQGGVGAAFFVRPSNRANTTIQTANVKSAVLIATWSPTSLTWVLDGETGDTARDMLNAAGTTYYYLLLG